MQPNYGLNGANRGGELVERMRCLEIETFCEKLRPEDYDHHNPSPETEDYNRIAWALGKQDHPWWPLKGSRRYHWYSDDFREELGEETLENFISAFKLEGYQECKHQHSRLRKGYEKVAIFCGPARNPLHAARQLRSGWWTSKCGDYQDINHRTLACVEGKNYGKAVFFLERRTKEPLSFGDRIVDWFRQLFGF